MWLPDKQEKTDTWGGEGIRAAAVYQSPTSIDSNLSRTSPKNGLPRFWGTLKSNIRHPVSGQKNWFISTQQGSRASLVCASMALLNR